MSSTAHSTQVRVRVSMRSVRICTARVSLTSTLSLRVTIVQLSVGRSHGSDWTSTSVVTDGLSTPSVDW